MNSADASRFAFTIVNGALKIESLTQPLVGQVAIFTPGGGAILHDFHASVDILDWASSQESALGIAGRVQGGSWNVEQHLPRQRENEPIHSQRPVVVFRWSFRCSGLECV